MVDVGNVVDNDGDHVCLQNLGLRVPYVLINGKLDNWENAVLGTVFLFLLTIFIIKEV